MDSNKIISFIIITYNRPEETIDVLDNILNHVNNVEGYTKEIVVINNDSSTSYESFDTYLNDLSETQRGKINYKVADENLGVPRGRNLGMEMAKGETMVFIDDDAVFIEPDVIETSLGIFDKYEVSKGVKIIAYREQNYYSKKYSIPTKNIKLAKEKAFFTNYFIGCAHVIKKDLIREVGDYITTFKYGVEEYDLAYKCLDAGYRIYYSSDITVLHKKSEKGRAKKLDLYKWTFENKVIIAYKFLPWFFVFTHFVMWTIYFLYHSKLNIFVWLETSFQLPQKVKPHTRKTISKETIKEIRNVGGRLWY